MNAFYTSTLAALALLLSGAAHADLPFSHPATAAYALKVSATQQARDAAPVLMGHAASPRWITVHANREHPAVAQARLAGVSAINPNTFLVQPPTAVQWTLGSEQSIAVAQR